MRWLTPEEYRLLETLVSLIVPSDKIGPGASEAEVAARLDALIAVSEDRQRLYRAGLHAIARIVRRLCGGLLGDLPLPLQQAIFAALENTYHKRHAGGAGLPARAKRKLRSLVYARRGYTDAIALFPYLLADTLDAFYCSPVAWEWLGYQGPPVSAGWYLSVGSEASHG